MLISVLSTCVSLGVSGSVCLSMSLPTGSSQVQHLMTVLISEHFGLYESEEVETETHTPTDTPRRAAQRCLVGWISQECMDPQSCPSPGLSPNPPREDLQPPLATSASSPDTNPPEPTPHGRTEGEEEVHTETKSKAKTEGKMEGKADGKSEGKGVSGASLSPSKQSKAPPSWRSSFKGGSGSGSGGGKGKLGGSAGDVSTVGGGNWLMNGLSSLRSHRRTASSGERLKESSLLLKDSSLSLKETSHSLTDSQKDSLDGSSHSHISSSHSHRNTSHSHRLSAYDNVTATPSSLSMPGETTSSWMSCEISLAESAGSEAATLNSETVSGSGQERPSEAGDALDLCVSSTGCSETDPGDDIKGQGPEMTQGLTSLVSELREELRRQRITYEGRIRKYALARC